MQSILQRVKQSKAFRHIEPLVWVAEKIDLLLGWWARTPSLVRAPVTKAIEYAMLFVMGWLALHYVDFLSAIRDNIGGVTIGALLLAAIGFFVIEGLRFRKRGVGYLYAKPTVTRRTKQLRERVPHGEDLRVFHTDVWEGREAPQEPQGTGLAIPTPDVILGPPRGDTGARVRAQSNGTWAWLFVTNESDEGILAVELEWLDTGKTEPPYSAPWREHNFQAGEPVARGQTAAANVCEVRASKSRHAMMRFYSRANPEGWFEKQLPIGNAIRCRATILRGSRQPIGAGDFTLIARAVDRLEFIRTPMPKSIPDKAVVRE